MPSEAAKKRYAEKNRELINQRAREKNEDPEVKAKKRAYYLSRRAEILANAKKRYEENPEKIKAAVAEYREAHRDEIKAYFKKRWAEIKADPKRYKAYMDDRRLSMSEWQAANREKRNAQQVERRKRDPEKHRAQSRALYAKDPEGRACKERERRASDREAYRAYLKSYYAKRCANDLEFVITYRLRNRIRDALKNGWKSDATAELLGCTITMLRAHIESLFTEGMTWDLFLDGKIHLDHKRPCASFDLTDPEQQKLCFHFSNLQPLWWLDNIKKGDKYDPGA